MREIIFRVRKKCFGGKWIEGRLIASEAYEVDPETVGQFTGLTDKNDVKIFEGDIVKYHDNVFEVRYSVIQARFLAFLPNGVFDPIAMKYGEVIGNIHDNPELLGGGDDAQEM